MKKDKKTMHKQDEEVLDKNLCRRDAIKNLLGIGACITVGAQLTEGFSAKAYAAENDDPSSILPQEGDCLVYADGENEGKPVDIEKLEVNKKYVTAWPMNPETGLVRDGSRFNKLLAIKLDPAELNEKTKAFSENGVVVYSGVCTHQGCDISAWLEKKKNLFCYCHYSRFDPRKFGKVTYGPARKKLPLLPIELKGSAIIVAGNFTRTPGGAKK